MALGTLFAPTQDRDVKGSGFTHKDGDVVRIDTGSYQLASNIVVSSADSGDEFSAVAVDSTNSLYVAGIVAGPGDLDYGDNITVTGLPAIPLTAGPGWNALLVKYR